MELPGTARPDDEFHEEPHLEEAKDPEETPNGVRLAVMRSHKNLGHPSKELLCRALRIGGANRVAIRAATELKCNVCSKSKPLKSINVENITSFLAESSAGDQSDDFTCIQSFTNLADRDLTKYQITQTLTVSWLHAHLERTRGTRLCTHTQRIALTDKRNPTV